MNNISNNNSNNISNNNSTKNPFTSYIIYPIIVPIIIFLAIYGSLYIGQKSYDDEINKMVDEKTYASYIELRKSERKYYIMMIVVSAFELLLVSTMLILILLYSVGAGNLLTKIYKPLVFGIILISFIRMYGGLIFPSLIVSKLENLYIRYVNEFPMQFLFGSIGLVSFLFIYITMSVFNNTISVKSVSESAWQIVAVLIVLLWRLARSLFNIINSAEFLDKSSSSDEKFDEYLANDTEKWMKVLGLDEIAEHIF